MTTQIVAKPAGMVTEPNKVGQFPPGAFANCKNVAIRSFGVMEHVQKFLNVPGFSLAGPLVGGIYAVSEGPVTCLLYEHTALGTWTMTACVASSFGSLYLVNYTVPAPYNTYLTNDCRTGVVLIRNRLIVSGTVRSFVWDLFPNTSTISASGPRDCGVYQTILAGRTTTLGDSDDPAYLGVNEHFSATSVLRYKFSDGYEVLGPPSVPSDYANLSTTLPQIRSTWSVYSTNTSNSTPTERKIDVYRTRAQSVGYDSVNNKYKPISTGSSFYLSKTADRNTGIQSIRDTTLPSTLGEALLTNVSVGGASALPLPPPPTSKTCAAFRGHAFYANRFDPATFTLLNPFFWGFMNLLSASDAVLTYGIGVRFQNSGLSATNGNPTVTGFTILTGVKVGQSFNVYRVDTGALVSTNNDVLSFTATTVTGTVNVTYTGSVRVEFLDRIEICGLNSAALSSPSAFVTQLFFPGLVGQLNPKCDIAAVGLEPITTDNPPGVYPNFVPTGGLTFRMRTNEPFTIRATNGDNFSPALPEIGAAVLSIPGKQQLNAFAWSENNEPENVPPSNYAFCGSGEIYKIVPTRDCLWFFCSDGLFRLSGAGGSVGTEYDWVIDPVDPSIIITNPMCAVTYREYVYALTNRGVVAISSEGSVRELSDGRINPSWLEGGGTNDVGLQNRSWFISFFPPATGSWPWLAVDGANDEIWVRCLQSNLAFTDRIWVYNVKTDTWCIRVPSYAGTEIPFFGIYNSTLGVVLTTFESSTAVVASAAYGATTDYETAEVTFQPFYGGSHGAPYTQKHWQDINLSFHSPQNTSAVATCRLRSQGEFGLIAGERVIPNSSPTGSAMEQSRVGFSIPRAFPAMSNSFQPHLVITSPSASGPLPGLQPIKLEGMQVSYLDFTEQRIRR